jgi:hypothetical protein
VEKNDCLVFLGSLLIEEEEDDDDDVAAAGSTLCWIFKFLTKWSRMLF